MPVKILLADKSITIQKVVEMLFSGREYEVVCVSDGEKALSEAARVMPDVALADVDLPRVDGYTFAKRLKEEAGLQTPVILMLSRDDVYDAARGASGGIVDNIAKPFESQELIAKVRKAVASAPQAAPAATVKPAPQAAAAPASPAPAPRPAPASPPVQQQAAPKSAPQQPQTAPAPPPQKTAMPRDIFDIIEEAPSDADLKPAPKPVPARTMPRPVEEEPLFDVEPEIQVEPEVEIEAEIEVEPEFEVEPEAGAGDDIFADEAVFPVGKKAVQEMRTNLGLADQENPVDQPIDIAGLEALGMAATSALDTFQKKPKPPAREEQQPRQWEPREYLPPRQPAPEPEQQPIPKPAPASGPAMTEEKIAALAGATIEKMAREYFKSLPPLQPPPIPDAVLRKAVEESIGAVVRQAVQETAREVIERIAWEVIPEMAEMLIKAEIERLKAEP